MYLRTEDWYWYPGEHVCVFLTFSVHFFCPHITIGGGKTSSLNLQLDTFLSVFRHAGSWLLLQPIPAASSRQFITGLRDKTNIHAHTPISLTCTVSGPWEEEARLADCVLLYRFSLFHTVGSRMVMMMFTSTLCYICNHGKLINIQYVLRAHHPPATIAPLILSTTK